MMSDVSRNLVKKVNVAFQVLFLLLLPTTHRLEVVSEQIHQFQSFAQIELSTKEKHISQVCCGQWAVVSQVSRITWGMIGKSNEEQ